MSIGQDLLNVPMGQMIRQMAFAIADAQVELDKASILVAKMMSGTEKDEDGKPVNMVRFDGQDMSMIELGFTPNFYQFVDTIIEVKIAVKMTRSSEYTRKATDSNSSNNKTNTNSSSGGGIFVGIFGGDSSKTNSERVTASVSTVDATYSSKYSYSAEGSSLLRTKLVPVPPPAVLEERIRGIIDREKAKEAAKTPTP